MQIDTKDKKIMLSLQKNVRKSLTSISKEVGLSIDSVHSRLKKMLAEGVLNPAPGIEPSKLGYPIIMDVKIKLRGGVDYSESGLVKYLMKNPRIIQISTITGSWDLTLVIIAKDGDDYSKIRTEIRMKLNDVLQDWNDSQVLKTFKFEQYDIINL